MRIDETTNEYIYFLYEGGANFQSLCKLLELNLSYNRNKARDLITSYINNFCKTEDNKHPLLNLPPHQTRELIDLLQQDSKCAKVSIFPDGPSVL